MGPIIQRAAECDITIDPDASVESIDREISALKEKVKITHNESAALRDKDLLERINIATDADDAKKAKGLRQQRWNEHNSRVYTRLKFQIGRAHV